MALAADRGPEMVAINDLLLTSVYWSLPNLFLGAERNWQEKLLALAGTLAIAGLPAIGWRAAGLTFAQASGSLKAAIPVCLLYGAFFVAIALAFPSGATSREDIAFQLTVPGLEEELFYRGVLLLALCRAFPGRWHFLGVGWSFGAVLSCWLFGMTHAFGFSDGSFSFDAPIMIFTALPSFIAVWLRLRTGSLLLPVVIHNFGNVIMLAL